MATRRTYRGLTDEQRQAERRSRLVAAARAAVGTTGYAALTIEGACKAAGVTARHFYEHFPTREDLLLVAYEEVLEEHRGAVAAALAAHDGDRLEEVVQAAVAAALAAWTADPAGARLAFVEVVGVSPRVEARRMRAIAEYTELVTAVADELHRRGLTPTPGRPIAARAIVGALIALVELWLTAPEPPATDALVAEAAMLALSAVRSPAPR